MLSSFGTRMEIISLIFLMIFYFCFRRPPFCFRSYSRKTHQIGNWWAQEMYNVFLFLWIHYFWIRFFFGGGVSHFLSKGERKVGGIYTCLLVPIEKRTDWTFQLFQPNKRKKQQGGGRRRVKNIFKKKTTLSHLRHLFSFTYLSGGFSFVVKRRRMGGTSAVMAPASLHQPPQSLGPNLKKKKKKKRNPWNIFYVFPGDGLTLTFRWWRRDPATVKQKTLGRKTPAISVSYLSKRKKKAISQQLEWVNIDLKKWK